MGREEKREEAQSVTRKRRTDENIRGTKKTNKSYIHTYIHTYIQTDQVRPGRRESELEEGSDEVNE